MNFSEYNAFLQKEINNNLTVVCGRHSHARHFILIFTLLKGFYSSDISSFVRSLEVLWKVLRKKPYRKIVSSKHKVKYDSFKFNNKNKHITHNFNKFWTICYWSAWFNSFSIFSQVRNKIFCIPDILRSVNMNSHKSI